MQLPDIWGTGSIVAFSALDGECTFEKSLIGVLSGDKIGINFITENNAFIYIEPKNVNNVSYSVVASDIIKGSLHTKDNNDFHFEFIFISQNTVLIRTPKCARLCVRFSEDANVTKNENLVSFEFENEKYALYSQSNEDYIISAFSYGNDSAEDAKKCFTTDINCEVSKKLSYFNSVPIAENSGKDTEMLYYKCFSVLKSMIYSPEGVFKTKWTSPDKVPHKKMWLWDSVFHSLALRHLSPDLAKEAIYAVLDTQREDGMIPHMSSPEKISQITQAPVLAWGVLELYKFTKDMTILTDTYDRLKKYIQWNMENRDENNNYLYEWFIDDTSVTCRCDECGMDNSPRFDNVTKMDCIDFSCFMAKEVQCLSEIAQLLDKQGEHIYWDVIFDRIKKSINDVLYCKEDGFYYDVILSDNSFKKVKAVSSFLPLFAGVCDKNQAYELLKHLKNEFNTPFAIPSIASDDETFGSDMWRGPVWINYNYLIAKGLYNYGFKSEADEIIEKTIAVMSKWYKNDGVIYEYYDSSDVLSPSRLNRKGHAVFPYMPHIKMQTIKDFGWSCALAIDMIISNRVM